MYLKDDKAVYFCYTHILHTITRYFVPLCTTLYHTFFALYIILFVFFFSNFYLSFAGKDFDLEIFSVVSVPFVDV